MLTARVTITLLVILMLGTNSVASQTTSASDSTNVVTSDWAFRLTESKADTVVTRHFAAPSAFQLEKGEGQVQSNLILNQSHMEVNPPESFLGEPIYRSNKPLKRPLRCVLLLKHPFSYFLNYYCFIL